MIIRGIPLSLWILVLILTFSIASCSMGLRQPATGPRPWCEVGYKVMPGEYMGPVSVTTADGRAFTFPLLAGDSVCLHTKPRPFEPPTIPDSLKPSRYPRTDGRRSRWT